MMILFPIVIVGALFCVYSGFIMWFYHAIIGVCDRVNDRKYLYYMSIDRI